ncbi:MAG TPA: SpoIIE family protein phosphatase [Phycisphaerales bacterium]|nr:SpoIIE family protein phosphatase [Phycisphaerales bacterium]HMP36674.1 SpoIIE family protein phosphatase [Phycisphaerales bacterium]
MTSSDDLVLESIAGPRQLRAELAAGAPHILGRGAGCDLVLEDPQTLVSRRHAALERIAGTWTICDLGSRHGTRLSGATLVAGRTVPVRDGDLLTIGPWTLTIGVGKSALGGRRLFAEEDRPGETGRVTTIRDSEATIAGDRLSLLMEAAEAIHDAESIAELGERVIATVAAGTQFANVALLGPLASNGSVEVHALRSAVTQQGDSFRFSRSILRQASMGSTVMLTGADIPTDDEHSIVSLGISEALCVPLVISGAVHALLYVDNRGMRSITSTRAARAVDDRAFAIALTRFAALALGSLRRREIEARLVESRAELEAAGQMQRLICPPSLGTLRGAEWATRFRPGRTVSGDFCDVVALSDGRIAFAVGDVSGKGVGAAVLGVLAQGFLRGALRESADLVAAFQALDRFLWDRAGGERFVTAWAGVVDPDAATLAYVDAGHGHARLVHRGGEATLLNEAGGPPLCASEDSEYAMATIPFPRDARLLVCTDGVIEQRGANATAGNLDFFGIDRTLAALDPAAAPAAIADAIIAAVCAHGGTEDLADDATVLVVRLS